MVDVAHVAGLNIGISCPSISWDMEMLFATGWTIELGSGGVSPLTLGKLSSLSVKYWNRAVVKGQPWYGALLYACTFRKKKGLFTMAAGNLFSKIR